MGSKFSFEWVPFYRELAHILLDYQNNRKQRKQNNACELQRFFLGQNEQHLQSERR